MEDGTFIAVAPEVSIFYEDRGVRLKARFDRLLRHAIVDVKSFAPRSPGRIDGPSGSAMKAVRNMRYDLRSEEHTSELQSLMRISYAVFCLKKKTTINYTHTNTSEKIC